MFIPNNINHNEIEESSVCYSDSDDENTIHNLKNSKTINCYSPKKKENNIKSSKTLEFIKNCKRLPDINNNNNHNKNKENSSTTNEYISNIPRKINTIKLVIIGKDKKSNLIKNHMNSKSRVNFKIDLPYLSNIKDKNEIQNRKSSVGTQRKFKTIKENSKKKINSYQSRSISNKIRDKK